MARFSVLIPAVICVCVWGGGDVNLTFTAYLVAGKENSHQKFKHDIKRVTVLKYFIFAHVDSCHV